MNNSEIEATSDPLLNLHIDVILSNKENFEGIHKIKLYKENYFENESKQLVQISTTRNDQDKYILQVIKLHT